MRTSASILKGQSGFSLTEVTIALGVISVTMLAFAGFSQLSSEYQSKVRNRNDLFQVKSEILRTVGNQQNWFEMISKANTDALGTGTNVNPALACIRDGTACTPGEHDLTVVTATGQVFLDSANPATGYTKTGVACQTYGAETAAGCDNRYKVTWSPVCPVSGPCIRPQVVVRLSFTTTDSNSTLTSLLGAQIPLDALIEQQRVQRPVVKRVSTYTNSTVVYNTESATVLQPLASVIGSYRPIIASFPSFTTAKGGTVTYLSESQIRYQPAAGYYGTDYFSYPVKDLPSGKTLRGNATVRVMTPYTWTGTAGDGNLRSNTSRNFCGKVVNGACSGTIFPASGWGLGYHYNLVFDDTCTNCNAEINGVAGAGPNSGYDVMLHSIEMKPTYRGTVRLTRKLLLGGAVGPRSIPVNLAVLGGTFDASAVSALGVDVQNKVGVAANENYGVKVTGAGRLIAPAVLTNYGAAYFETPASFVHNNGEFQIGGIWAVNSILWAPNVDFYNWRLVPGSSVNLSSNFNILHNAYISPSGNRLSNGEHPVTGLAVPNPTISVKGDIILSGHGGFHCNAWTNGCYGPHFELNGTGDQTITGIDDSGFTLDRTTIDANVPAAPSISINKTSGRTTMTGVIGIRRDFTVKNIADYDFSASKLAFGQLDCGTSTVTATGVTLGDFYELGQGCGGGMEYGTSNFTVRNFYMYGSSIGIWSTGYNGATINVTGNVYQNARHHHDMRQSRAARIRFVGTGDQYLRRVPLPDGTTPDSMVTAMNYAVDKPSGTLYLEGRITTLGDFIVDNGNVIGNPGSALVNTDHGANYDKTVLRAPAAQFESIEVGHTLQLASDIRTKNLKIGMADASIGGLYIYPGSSKFLVSRNLELKFPKAFIDPAVPTQPNIVLEGAGEQRVTFTALPANRLFNNVNLLVAKTGGSVTYEGTGTLRRVCVNSPTFVMDSSSSLTVTDKLGIGPTGVFVQNGATVSGTVTNPDTACN